MSLGRIVRTLLSDRHARIAGRLYRALFVDLAKVSAAIAAEIPTGARVLDVGGGDGEPLNRLLELRPDIQVTTIDVAPRVGQWIEPRYLDRVTCMPSTSLEAYLASGAALPDILLLCDVMHHVPVAEREPFLAVVGDLLRRSQRTRLIVKDVEPGHWRATLGWLSDRYVTGDDAVRLISRNELVAAMRRAHDELRWHETSVFSSDPPNYALVFRH
jgi:hypothetical protein